MIGNYENQLFSSFALFLENRISNKGQGYTNVSSNFYPISGQFAGYYTYGTPYTPIVYDNSVSGANIMTGIYLNNTFITTGQSGFVGINYEKGYIYFNTPVHYNVSGNYAVRDFHTVLTSENEANLLFKNKYYIKAKFPQTLTGVPDGYLPFPVIFIREGGSNTNPFAFGGQEQTFSYIKCIIIADSLFNLHATQGLIKNAIRQPMALFSPSEYPLNSIGSLVSGTYNYTGMANIKINEQNFAFLDDVNVGKQTQRLLFSMVDTLPRSTYFNFVDLTFSKVRNPRNE